MNTGIWVWWVNRDKSAKYNGFSEIYLDLFWGKPTDKEVNDYIKLCNKNNIKVFTRSFSVKAKDMTPTGVTFSSNGSEMYIIGNDSDSVHQYSLPKNNNFYTLSLGCEF